MTTTTDLQTQIKSIIENAHGTEHWYRHWATSHMVYTDSIKTLAEQCGMYWFVDVVASHMPSVLKQFKETEETFFVASIITDDEQRAVFTISYECYDDDGNYLEKNVAYQEIPYVDLPKQFEMKFFLELAEWEQPIYCLMCPGDH